MLPFSSHLPGKSPHASLPGLFIGKHTWWYVIMIVAATRPERASQALTKHTCICQRHREVFSETFLPACSSKCFRVTLTPSLFTATWQPALMDPLYRWGNRGTSCQQMAEPGFEPKVMAPDSVFTFQHSHWLSAVVLFLLLSPKAENPIPHFIQIGLQEHRLYFNFST